MEIDEIEYEIFVDGALVKKATIQQINPCIVAENMIRVLMQLDSEIRDVIPLLITRYPPGKVNFIENKGIITLNIQNRLVTLYPSGKISMNKTIDKEDAIEAVTEIMKVINEVFIELNSDNGLDYSEIKEKLSKIGPLALYNCLPKTNCEKCGEVTCMAFAIKLLSGDIKLDKCKPLRDREHNKDVSCLKELLGIQIMLSMGWNE
ncbi:(Fe-S)-binding protein [Methanobacterium spitsbergense]|uniref:Fe-S cluster domain-containing protein n=1 Tax=Methanobacterium spitsbergense TaxID=2874285 RepID=A0A8T5UWF8_9EURY|nr:(Fe-S)-binding protein [Methanobacterium spitsbergense]MBZ2165019.1 Fe-S cluster domain-containing protein [Methanobacterium spitsbergense]